MSLRTVVYIRKSSKDKDENHQRHSIKRQKVDIQTFIKRYNAVAPSDERLRVVDEKLDIVTEDASAKIPFNRPEFAKMVERIQKGKYDVLLCAELSRLSRNAIDTATLVQLLEDKQLKKIMTTDKVFTTTPTDKFTLSLFLSVAKFENDQRAVNTKSGMANQKESGETTHRAPMGYINVGTKKGQKSVEADAMTFDNVRLLWEMMMTGDYSVADLKEEGDRLGITYVKSGKRHMPSATAYRYMFTNRYYTGRMIVQNRETGEKGWGNGNHPAMVTDEEFDRVQIILQSRGYKHQKVSRTPSIEEILNEILVCGKCKTIVNGIEKPTKMTFENKTRYTCVQCKHRYSASADKPCPKCNEPVSKDTKIDSHRYYHCCKKQSSKICAHDFYGEGKTAKNVAAEKIEAFLDAKLSKLHITEDLFKVLSRQLYTLWLQSQEVIQRKEEEIEARKKELREARLKLRGKSFTTEGLTKAEQDDLDELMDMNKQKEEDLDEELEKLRDEEEEKFEKSWQTMNALREAKSVFGEKEVGIEPKRKMVLSMVSNLTISDENWTINWKIPFDTVAKSGIANISNTISGKRKGELNYNWLRMLGVF